MKNKKITVPLDQISYAKLKFIALQEKRFLCRQVMFWIRQEIREYERKNGEIPQE